LVLLELPRKRRTATVKIIGKIWKSFVDSMTSWAIAMGRAKAAAELTRMGRHQEARRLLLEDIK
jgi:hypothetical protein